MKKTIVFLALVLATFGETVSVNMDYLVNKHPKIEIAKKDIEAERIRLEKIINEKAEQLSIEREALEAKKDKITDKEIEEFYKKEDDLEKLYMQSQNALLNFKDTKLKAIYGEVVEAVKTFHKIKKYDAIVEKNAIYAGSEKIKDVSEEVLKTFQNTEKINLK